MKGLVTLASCLLAVPVAAVPAALDNREVDSSIAACAVTTVYETEYVTATGAPTAASSAPSPAAAQSTPASAGSKSGAGSSPIERPAPPSGHSSPAAVPSPQSPPAVSGGGSVNTVSSSEYSNSLYFTNWGIYGANFQPQQIPSDKVTRVLYAFADIASDGTVKSSDNYADLQKHYPTDSWNDLGNNAYGSVKQLYLLKKKNRQLKVLLSIGGWTYSPKFPPVAATEAGRQTFASSAVKLVADWGFDGIDIDWEYPASATEAHNFVLLLQACRQALDAYASQHAPGYHFLITVASPAGPKNYNNMDLAGMDAWVDAWNLMAYDYAGSWDSTSGHQANIYLNPNNVQATKYSTEQAVADYVAKGIAPHKIMMGLPLYGRSFEATSGLGQSYNGVGAGTIQSGIWLYKDLPRAGASEAYDEVARASYSYDTSARELISYDNVASVQQKMSYLSQKGLGGAVFWEASGDRNDSSSLVAAVANRLGGADYARLDTTHNLLSYPASQYDNIRAGVPGA